MLARQRSPLLVLALFVAGAIWWTWPLATALDAGYLFPGTKTPAASRADAYLVTWMMAWTGRALRTQPLHLFDANIWYPIRDALAFSEHMIGAALQVLPFQMAGMDPVAIHNLFVIGSYVVAAIGTALVVRDLGGTWTGGFVAGALYAFGPHRTWLMGHGHLLGSHLVPFVFLFLQRLLRDGRWRDGGLFVVVLLLQVLTSVYHLYYFGVGVGVFVLAWALCRVPAAQGAYRRVAFCLAVCVAVVVPTMLPYADVRARFALARDPVQTLWFSWVGLNFLGGLAMPIAHYRARLLGQGLTPSVLGLGAFAAVVCGSFCGAPAGRGGRRVGLVYLLVGLSLSLLALGPRMRMGAFTGEIVGPYELLQRVVPGFDGLRAPGRAAIGAVCAFAVLAGLCVSAFGRRAETPLARALVVVLAAVLVGSELGPPPATRFEPLPWARQSAGVYRWLAGVPGQPAVIELPIGAPDVDAGYMVRSIAHWKWLMNGYTGFAPAATYVRSTFYGFPDPASLRLLKELDVRYAILHPARLPPAHRNICVEIGRGDHPELVLRYADDDACAVEIVSALPAPARPPDRLVPREALAVTASSHADARAAVDGDLATHWTDDVDEKQDAWLRVDLPSPRRLRRLVIDLGPHFGEFLRLYRIETSADGETWTAVVAPSFGEAPLVGMRTGPDRLAVEVALPDVTTQHLRIVRPKHTDGSPFDLWSNWTRWGVHELHLYEATD